jgi:hypothetical protein
MPDYGPLWTEKFGTLSPKRTINVVARECQIFCLIDILAQWDETSNSFGLSCPVVGQLLPEVSKKCKIEMEIENPDRPSTRAVWIFGLLLYCK